MTIDQEIKQTKAFKNIYHKLAVNIMFTNSWTENYIKEVFKEEHVTPQQYNILRILRGSRPQPLSTLQIRERMMDKMSDTSRIVDRLVIKNLVSKKPNQKDLRLVEVAITDKGLELLSRLDDIDEKMTSYYSNLNEEEATQLSNLLDKLHENKNLKF